MPLNTLRLNHNPSSHPNDRIVFIKPLPRPPAQTTDYQTADTLLRAIAAQCLPIMKSHYLSVTTLEEHEPNPEFIGRNFNNGEVIQLVLRGRNGGWLPVNMIQMVMMHELAHNVHMNHSRKFWETRNVFATEMKGLWARSYTGEGFWGTGRTLMDLQGAMQGNEVRSEELKDLPLCGGTYRSRRRKRKAKKDDGLTWKEKRDRRIEKKFGKNGVALGEDEDMRLSLEISGKGPVGVKPRVAQSKRGRELRAAAALARFETNKHEIDKLNKEERVDETQSEDDYEDADVGQEDARDVNGVKLLDSKGQSMIKVCEEEDVDDVNVKQEMQELEELDLHNSTQLTPNGQTNGSMSQPSAPAIPKPSRKPRSLYDIPQHREKTKPELLREDSPVDTPGVKPTPEIPLSTPTRTESDHKSDTSSPPPTTISSFPATSAINTKTITCSICSLTNEAQNPTCTACGHVLDRRKDPRSWVCANESCRALGYVNSGDAGICGLCAEKKDR